MTASPPLSGQTIKTLEAEDTLLLDPFLCRHAPTSLKLLHDLRRGGIVCEGLAHQAHYIGVVDRHGLHGVLALGADDTVTLQCPDIAHLPALLRAWKEWFAGGALGLLGPRPQIDALLELLATGKEGLPLSFSTTEDVYVAPVARVTPPPAADGWSCRLASADEFPQLCEWHLSFLQETAHQTDTEALRAHIHADLSQRYHQNGLFVLCAGQGQAYASLHVILTVGETAQLGALYVPPAQRLQGYGSALMCLTTRWLGQRGITRSTFLSPTHFQRLNARLMACGFQRDTPFGLTFFSEPVSPD